MVTVKKLYKCQKAVVIKKERQRAGINDVNFGANKNDVFAAMKALKPATFNIYLYLISNTEGYTFGLSKQDIIEKTGIGERSYTTAIQTLIEKGYLIYTGQMATDGIESAPLYEFRARPDAKFA